MNKLVAAGLGFLLLAGTAAVAGAAAKAVSVTGEVIDTYCYSAMGAKGPSHRQCAIDCAKAGIPVGLLQKGTNKVYVLLPNKDKSGLPEAVINKMGEQATVTGKVHRVPGATFLTVESIK